MAAVPVQIDGVFYPHNKRMGPIKGTMLGHASIFGLGIGGGPIIPPDGGGGGPDPEPPDHIWGPTDPRPENPIVIPPEPPDVPTNPGTPNTVVKGAPDGGWGYYTDEHSVMYAAYNPADPHAGPKRRR